MLNKSISDLRRGLDLYHVWMYQAYHEISSKYRRTILGSVWIAGAMVATSVALSIMIGVIQNHDVRDVLPYVMGGIMAFALTGSYVLNEAPEVYMASSNIIKNHAYPYTYYSFESLTRAFLIYAHNFVVFYITLAVLGRFSLPHWSLAFGLVVSYLTAFFWGSLASMVAARFRDLRFLLPFISQIVFFLTPVFWEPKGVVGWRFYLLQFNPFYGLTEIVRQPMLGKAASNMAWEQALIALIVGVLMWLILFSANRKKIAFWI